MALGQRVAELRDAKAMTQDDLAARAGVSLRYVQRVEAADVSPSIPKLVDLAEALDVGMTELFEEPRELRPRPKRGRPRTRK